MPKAVVTNAVSEKVDLKSLPEGWVQVRRMNYGEKLLRSNMATQFVVGGSAQVKDFNGELKLNTEIVALWDFANLIVDHNLEDENGAKLDFKNPVNVKRLSGEIGEEVGKIIDDFNDIEGKAEVKN